jgi:hypothetical protein
LYIASHTCAFGTLSGKLRAMSHELWSKKSS